MIRTSPKAESFVDTPEGRGTVVDLDLLRQRVSVRMEDDPNTVSVFSNSDIAVLRNGKAKKNDPPIPADLAPISGGGKRVKKEPESIHLDSIRFRYSTETIADEQNKPFEDGPAETPATPPSTGEGRPARPRSRRREGAGGQRPGAEPRRDQPKNDPQPQRDGNQPGAEGEQAKRPRRRSGGRRRPPKPTAEE